MSDKDGGPAFPCEQRHTGDGMWNPTYEPGMTLLDYFAGQALASGLYPGNARDYAGCALWCHFMADAMLDERGKP